MVIITREHSTSTWPTRVLHPRPAQPLRQVHHRHLPHLLHQREAIVIQKSLQMKRMMNQSNRKLMTRSLPRMRPMLTVADAIDVKDPMLARLHMVKDVGKLADTREQGMHQPTLLKMAVHPTVAKLLIDIVRRLMVTNMEVMVT